MRGRVPHRVKRTTNLIPAGDAFFLQPVLLCPLSVSQTLRDFFVSAIDFCLQDSLKGEASGFFKLSSVFAFLQKIIQTTLLVVWIIAYFHKIGLCRGIFILLPIPLCVPILSDLLENIKSEELEGDRKRIGTFLIGKKTIKIQSDAADL